MWLYQISPTLWDPCRYRMEIWESERWSWPVGKISGGGEKPKPGDLMVMFFAPSGGDDPGFYGWAVVQEWIPMAVAQLRFRPVAPSDTLKMCPWWDTQAEKLANKIRGRMKQRTLWLVPEKIVPELRQGILSWVTGNK